MFKVDTDNVETYILGDFNINLWQNGFLLSCQSVSNDVKNYFDFSMFGLKQLIESPPWITCSSSTIIDHILGSFPNRVTRWGILDVRLSDQLPTNLLYKKNYQDRKRWSWANKIPFFQKLYHWWLQKGSGWN